MKKQTNTFNCFRCLIPSTPLFPISFHSHLMFLSVYRCIQYSGHFVQRLSLVLAGTPMIVAPAPGEVSKEGDMVTVKCAAYGLPAPQFTWQPSGKEVRNVKLMQLNTPCHYLIHFLSYFSNLWAVELLAELIAVYLKGSKEEPGWCQGW